LFKVERKKILFLVAHRLGRSPGQRFRFEQYLDYLHENGFDYHISHLIDEKDDKDFYAKGKYFAKARILWKSLRKRLKDLKTAADYDIVFMYRDAHMLGSTYFERKLKKKPCKLVLDFDDSIWLNDVSQGNQKLAFLKKPSKVNRIIGLCDLIITGNKYLADYARKFNANVVVVPTTIDTDYYKPINKTANDKICIGWTGSSTTLKHLAISEPWLKLLKDKYGEKINFRVISDVPFKSDLKDLVNVKWKRDSEVSDLACVDIGIMPLPNDAWSKGKCGFKGLQYMALSIPAVMSPVGVNTEIVADGVNGFLADSEKEWIDKLSRLIESKELRLKLGEAGRETVVGRYSFNSQKEIYLSLFKNLIGS